MIISEDSPFRRPRADLDARQASFIDGIRLTAESLDLAYSRLVGILAQFSESGNLVSSMAAPFLDAWSVIDSVHRLRGLLSQMPGLPKSGPKYKLFVRKTAKATDFRNVIQHLNGELKSMSDQGHSAWGMLAWIYGIGPEHLYSCAMFPGRVITGNAPLINPAGLAIRPPIDHVTLRCKNESVSLSDMHSSAVDLIHAMEKSLSEHFDGQSCNGADVFLRVEFSASDAADLASIEARGTD